MKIGIVGCGGVGSSAAYAISMSGLARQIVLVDKDGDRAKAEAADLLHASPFSHPFSASGGSFEALANCRAVIIAAGAAQKKGETRLDLLKRNVDIFRQIVPEILDNAPEAVIIVVTNPVDLLTNLTAKEATSRNLRSARVIGSGTTLDTARFRALLGEHIGVDPAHVHAYVVGEHGDSEVLTWSLVDISGAPLDDFCSLQGKTCDQTDKDRIDDEVRNAAYRIIQGKGLTNWGIASCVAQIVSVVLKDQRAILTVSHPTDPSTDLKGACLSLPRLLGGDGVLAAIPLPLAENERQALRESAAMLTEAAEKVGLNS